MSLAAYVGWKPPAASAKKGVGTPATAGYNGDQPPPGYNDLSELVDMFEGGVIQ